MNYVNSNSDQWHNYVVRARRHDNMHGTPWPTISTEFLNSLLSHNDKIHVSFVVDQQNEINVQTR